MTDFLSKSRCGPKRLNTLHCSELIPIILLHLMSLCFLTVSFVKLLPLIPFFFCPQMLLLIYFGYHNPHIISLSLPGTEVTVYIHIFICQRKMEQNLGGWVGKMTATWNCLEQQNTFNQKEIFKIITLFLALQKHSAQTKFTPVFLN